MKNLKDILSLYSVEGKEIVQETLKSSLTLLERNFEERERMICAFLPEERRFERLFSESMELIQEFENDSVHSLFGLQFGVKDIFHVNGFQTLCGSNVPNQFNDDDFEAVCVTKLKNLGCVIFGKTQTTEFAYFAPSPTRNPCNLAFSPGGSSSGSAAAVASGLVPLALGTQSIGSISRPASYCGCIGFKPSYNRIDKAGVVPLSPSLDHIGFFTNDIQLSEDVASVLCENWVEDTVESEVDIINFGVPTGKYLQRAEPEMLEVFYDVISQVEKTKHKVEFIPMLDNIDILCEHVGVILSKEASQCHQDLIEKYGNLLHPKTAELINKGFEISEEEYIESKGQCKVLRDNIESVMNSHGVHVWLSPAATGPAPPIELKSTGDPIMNLPWSMSGLPTIAIPMGKNHQNLPLGLQVAGKYWKDEEIFGIARSLENTKIVV